MKLTAALLRRAAEAAMEHSKYNAMMSEAFNERYGHTYSDVDCDPLIDQLDYGSGGIPTLAECDEEMARCGAPKLP